MYAKNFSFSRKVLLSNPDYLKKIIENNVDKYLKDKKKSFNDDLFYSWWLDNYVNKIKRLGFFKSFETFELHFLRNKGSSSKKGKKLLKKNN